jgi:hypothetical protein
VIVIRGANGLYSSGGDIAGFLKVGRDGMLAPEPSRPHPDCGLAETVEFSPAILVVPDERGRLRSSVPAFGYIGYPPQTRPLMLARRRMHRAARNQTNERHPENGALSSHHYLHASVRGPQLCLI